MKRYGRYAEDADDAITAMYIGSLNGDDATRILRMSDDEIQEIEDQIKDEEGGENGDPETDGMFATNEPSEGEK